MIKVENKFKKLNNKKLTKDDHIPNITLKQVLRVISFIIYTIVFNNMFNLGFFPADWKKARVIAFAKKR